MYIIGQFIIFVFTVEQRFMVEQFDDPVNFLFQFCASLYQHKSNGKFVWQVYHFVTQVWSQ